MGEFKDRETEYNKTVEDLTDGFVEKMEKIIFDNIIESGKSLERIEALKNDLEHVAPEDRAEYVKDKYFKARLHSVLPISLLEDTMWRGYMEELGKAYVKAVSKEESDD